MHRVLLAPALYAVDSFFPTQPQKTVRSVEFRYTSAYIIWSDILRCPECSDSFTYWDVAVDQEHGNIRDSFHCPKCDLLISKSLSEIVTRASFDASKGEVSQTAIRDPVIAVLEKGKRSERFHLKSTQRNVFRI